MKDIKNKLKDFFDKESVKVLEIDDYTDSTSSICEITYLVELKDGSKINLDDLISFAIGQKIKVQAF